jgi:isoleucyl-tRNA synthetase
MTRDREDTKEIIKEVLEKVSLLLAPLAPYITENIYSQLKKDSVHLSSWAKTDKKRINKNLEKRAENSFKIIEKGLAERNKIKIGLKWPLGKVIIYIKGKENYGEFLEIIKTQLNVKEIKFESPASKGTEFDLEFDTKLTSELEAEGYAREVSRHVQACRKKRGLKKQDKIELFISTDEELNKIIEDQREFIKERTNSKTLEVNSENVTTHKERFKNSFDFKIKDKKGGVFINKITTKR